MKFEVNKYYKYILAILLIILSLYKSDLSAAYNLNEANDAAQRLKSLKIINSDLTSSEITRAELVTIIVRAFGQEDNARLLQGSSMFPDTASHWASGNIAMAKALIEKAGGDPIGMPDGTFNPDGKLTPAQAVAFLMKFLGVKGDPAKAWPSNYLDAAVESGLISSDDKALIASQANTNATRGLVFYLFDRSFSTYKLNDGRTVYNKYVDNVKPVITVTDKVVENGKVTIYGTYEERALASISVGQTKAGFDKGKWNITLDLSEGNNEFKVLAIDIVGNKTEVKVEVENKKKPEAPKGVKAAEEEANIKVSWTAAEGIDSYTVKRSETSGGPYTDLSSDIKEEHYIDRDVKPNVKYYYVVAAQNADGLSNNSEEASALVSKNFVKVSISETSVKMKTYDEKYIGFSVTPPDSIIFTNIDNIDAVSATIMGKGEKREMRLYAGAKAGDAVVKIRVSSPGYTDNVISVNVNVEQGLERHSTSITPILSTTAPEITGYTVEAGSQQATSKIIGLDYQGAASFKVMTHPTPLETQYVGGAPSNYACPYIEGDDIAETTVGEYLAIYALDGNGNIIAFSNHLLVDGEVTAPPLEVVQFIPGTISGNTLICALRHSGAENFAYTISNSAFDYPLQGDNVSGSPTTVVEGDEISVTDGQHIGIYALDSLGKIMGFTDHLIAGSEINGGSFL